MSADIQTPAARGRSLAGLGVVWTIGHSTRPLDEFLALLNEHGIEAVADVRRFPGSRRLPAYGSRSLSSTLKAHGVAYRWIPALGGRRTPRPDSPNVAWRNASFRGYADYMATQAFADGLGTLLDLASDAPTAMMCAEALWWRCHRALIADALTIAGARVIHILGPRRTVEHRLTSPARVDGGRLSYDRLVKTSTPRSK